MTDNNKLAPAELPDIDPAETSEWLESLHAVIEREGPERAHFLLSKLIEQTRRSGGFVPFEPWTDYVNTIPPHLEAKSPGNHAVEWRLRSIIRWNAMAMVIQANRINAGVGGHIASFASSATLYDVGFNHFFRAPSDDHGGDLVYIQGHCAPGIYARAFLEGRLNEDDLLRFRQEINDPDSPTGSKGRGLSSYPHPWLMPDFWQMATVSMGLGPIMAIYQARFMKYLHNRGIADTSNRKVWCFCGDGEMDEVESLGAIDVAAREKLDNLIFVVNCNLQRLDGPVRGDSKIIQELEGEFRGAGWRVIKLIWGSYWDPLLAKDKDGLLRKRMMEVVDGTYQACKAKGGAYTREVFFGAYPELKEMVANLSDDDIARLNRGGHDPHKVYAAYAHAMKEQGKPVVILAKTVKGYGMGEAGEGQNITHQQKKMGEEALRQFRDRFDIPIPDDKIGETPFYKPAEDSEEIQYLKSRREALGGPLPQRRQKADVLEVPGLEAFESVTKGSGDREISTTMAFVRLLQVLVRDKKMGERVVPIVPDEARTFGMEGMFRQLGIYAHSGQLYEPMDSDQLAYYREDIKGQILEEGITEAGAMSSWIAAATSYSSHGVSMIPFYIYYSMFGHQRIGDLCWAAGDMRARGFLLGGTAGRTTLNGEGLQHEDGHTHLIAATIPNCVAYDPTFGYELAVVMADGLKRMYVDQEDVHYYITVMNENYQHPAMPEGVEDGIRRGMYLFQEGDKRVKDKVQLLGSGTILREVIAAAELLKDDWGIDADVWSCPSFTLLARDGQDTERHNLLHPGKPKKAFVTENLEGRGKVAVAATDYMKVFSDQIRAWVPMEYEVLGTDGFGRSDTRERLRNHFEVDRRWITLAALKGLCDAGEIKPAEVTKAIKKYGIDPKKPNPVTV